MFWRRDWRSAIRNGACGAKCSSVARNLIARWKEYVNAIRGVLSKMSQHSKESPVCGKMILAHFVDFGYNGKIIDTYDIANAAGCPMRYGAHVGMNENLTCHASLSFLKRCL